MAPSVCSSKATTKSWKILGSMWPSLVSESGLAQSTQTMHFMRSLHRYAHYLFYNVQIIYSHILFFFDATIQSNNLFVFSHCFWFLPLSFSFTTCFPLLEDY